MSVFTVITESLFLILTRYSCFKASLLQWYLTTYTSSTILQSGYLSTIAFITAFGNLILLYFSKVSTILPSLLKEAIILPSGILKVTL